MSLSVALVVNGFPVLSQTFVLNQAAGLVERGHDVTILALGERVPADAKQHPIVRQYGLLDRTVYLPKPPRSIVARLARLGPALWRGGRPARDLLARSLDLRRYHPLTAVSLRNFYLGLPFLTLGEFDVVHCQFGTLGLAALALRQLGVLEGPLVVSFRGYDASRVVQEHGREVYSELFRHGELFVPNCEYFRRRLVDLGCDAKRIEVLRSGIDCSRFQIPREPRPRVGPTRLVAIGRLVEKKGLAYAIEAVAIARRHDPGITLQIIGDGPLRSALQAQINRLNLADCVRLVGELDQDELIAALGQADLLVAPSVRAADGDEDAPVNTLKEAMAMGLPVIATNHGGISELVDDGASGYLCPERDSAALAQTILRLARERNRWPAMGRAGRRRVLDHFNMEPLNDRLVELYRRAIKSASEPIVLPFRRPDSPAALARTRAA
jgi:colanic acid/amylovoran biosynthesis glycosyltransferase